LSHWSRQPHRIEHVEEPEQPNTAWCVLKSHQLLAVEDDIATVAKMAGHANLQTIARYDRRPKQAKQKETGLLHVPYHR
jgi:hypothetical protein